MWYNKANYSLRGQGKVPVLPLRTAILGARTAILRGRTRVLRARTAVLRHKIGGQRARTEYASRRSSSPTLLGLQSL